MLRAREVVSALAIDIVASEVPSVSGNVWMRIAPGRKEGGDIVGWDKEFGGLATTSVTGFEAKLDTAGRQINWPLAPRDDERLSFAPGESRD